jgi:hypothetical protein
VDRIWNHIKNNNQPVVVITDLNKLDYYNGQTSYYPAWNAKRSLHYQVVYGIFEKNGEKYFRIHDPLYRNRQNKEYSKYQLQDIIAMAEMAPVWVYQYGTVEARKSNPAYTMLVSGS